MFANADPDVPFAFGVINGLPVPETFVEVLSVPDEATEIVLCSDGYLGVPTTLCEGEAALHASLLADPDRVGTHRSTKGMAAGAVSFDDRTYLRVALT